MSRTLRVALGLALAAVVLLGCSRPVRSVPAESPLEHAVRFTELPLESGPRELSTRSGPDGTRAVVPAPGALDWNSRLAIELDRERLEALGQVGASFVAELDALVAQREVLNASLASWADLAEARAAAARAFRDYLAGSRDDARAKQAAEQALDTRAQVQRAFRDAFRGYVMEHAPERYNEFSTAYRTIGSGTAVRDLLQDELARVEAAWQALNSRARRQGVALRVEAFLDSPGKDAQPVHVDGYDRLPEGRLERRDRWGLALEGAAREQFEAAQAQAEQVATSLERARRGEQRWAEALAELTQTALGPLAEVASQGIVLRARLSEVDSLAASTKLAVEALPAELATALQAAGATEAQALGAALQAEADALQTTLQGLPELAQLVSSGARLAELLRSPSPQDFLTIQQLIGGLDEQLKAVLDGVESELAGATERGRGQVEAALAAFPDALESAARQTWADSAAKQRLEEWWELAEQIGTFVSGLQDLFEAGRLDQLSPVPMSLRNPEAIEVPLASIRDTSIDLQRTPRLAGDVLTVRVTALQNGEVLNAPLQVAFGLEPYGWQARLDPSVVLARPTQLGGRTERFEFAPALSWLHSYKPRPETDSWWGQRQRDLRLSIGPHAVFLNTTEESDLEIGLGVTIGVWDGVLQGGFGWNLGADRDVDGDHYLFVGSSLVSLLQRFQGGD